MFLLRHGETVFNKIYGPTRRDPGIRDPRLTDRGRSQAAATAEQLRADPVTRLITSPYTRTLETAEIIARALDVPITVDAMVRERTAYSCDVGSACSKLAVSWTTLGFDHIDEIWWHEDEEHETAFADRCDRFRRRMAGIRDWSTIAVVTHWGVIRALTGLRIANGELVRIDPTRTPGGDPAGG